jgi:hypothetical protein
MYKIDNASFREYSGRIVINAAGSHTIQFYSIDNVGNSEQRQSKSFYVQSPEEMLEIRNVRVTGITADSGRVYFETTVEANAKMEYGTSASMGMSKESVFGTSHEVMLTDLKPATRYYLKVKAWNEKRGAESKMIEFETKHENFRIFGVAVQSLADSAIVSWETTIKAECEFYYGEQALEKKLVTKKGKQHTIELAELEPNTSYRFKIVAKSASEIVEYEGMFFTLEIPARPAIISISVEPRSGVAQEGTAFTFTATLANIERAKYIWDFGDGTTEEGVLSELIGEGTQMSELQATHAFYLDIEEKKEFEVKLTLMQVDSNESIDEKSIKVVVVRAPIKARLIEPREIKRKDQPIEIKIELRDMNNSPIRKKNLSAFWSYIRGKPISFTEEKPGLFKARFNPALEVNNLEFLSLELQARVAGNSELISVKLPLKFEPLKLVPKSSLKNMIFYLGSRLGMYRHEFLFQEGLAKRDVRSIYVKAMLIGKDWKKPVRVIPLSLGVMLDINYKITEEDAENGLMLVLQGYDEFGNIIDERVRLNISMQNPDFQLKVLWPKENTIEILKETPIVARIDSKKGWKGIVSIDCGIIKDTMRYDAENDVHFYNIKLPSDYKQEKLKCKLRAKALDADAEAIANLELDVVAELKIELVKPVEGVSSLVEEPEEIVLNISYANGTELDIDTLEGVLVIDDVASEVVFHKIDKHYIVKLSEPLSFGEHVLEINIADPIRGEKKAYVKINRALAITEIIAGLAIVFAIAFGLYVGSKITFAIKDSKAKLMAEKQNALALLKKLKAEYFKRHISESEFREQYVNAQKKLKEIERRIKRKEYLFFWRK